MTLIAVPFPVAGQDAVAIVSARVLDGLGGPPIEDAVIVVSGDTIAAVGPSASVRVPDGVEVIDAAGGTILPGLADMHVHLGGGWDGETADLIDGPRLRFVGPVLDGPAPVWPPISYGLTSIAQAEKTAEQLAAGGVSALKATGRCRTP